MKSTLATMLLSLSTLTVGAGAVLGLVNTATEKPIEDARQQALATAITEVLPPFDSSPAATATEGADGTTIYPAFVGDSLSGVAVESYSDAGFSGRITILCGFGSTGTLIDYRVTGSTETPGLGAKADSWFRDGDADIRGTRAPLAVRADGGEVDAISGATITSRAFVEAVNRARSAFNSYMSSRND